MTKDEFLSLQTRNVIENFENNGTIIPLFVILNTNGETNSIGTPFNGINSKNNFALFARLMCQNPEAIACIYAFEVWVSRNTLEMDKWPSKCSDRETNIMILYFTRDGIHDLHLYKPDKDGKLQYVMSENSYRGRIDDPFRKIMTKTEIEEAICKFKDTAINLLCQVNEKLQTTFNILFFLNDSEEEVSVSRLSDEEWMNKNWLKKIINEKCEDYRTLAFILAFPTDNNTIHFILEANGIQDEYSYKINPSTNTLEFESKSNYTGEFSGFFKNNEI